MEETESRAAATSAEILEPLELRYSDLRLLSSTAASSSSGQGGSDAVDDLVLRRRLQSISADVIRALGPSGPGLLSITDVPEVPALRRTLLPIARKLALLRREDRNKILTDHGLGSDVPLKDVDRSVSSFALQLKYMKDSDSGSNGLSSEVNSASASDASSGHENDDFQMLGCAFRELGLCMMEIGLQLARVCDTEIRSGELERSILESCMAKGRLIHYHSALDGLMLRELVKKKKGSNNVASTLFKNNEPVFRSSPSSKFHDGVPLPEQPNGKSEASGTNSCRTSLSDLWQQWHYDYGIFTILTTPMFLSMSRTEAKNPRSPASDVECSSPEGHTYLQLFDTIRDKILVLKSKPESFIVQVGESADILSGGRLRSTLHSVFRPIAADNISRETFVVFMQPAWSKVLYRPEHMFEDLRSQELVASLPNQTLKSAYIEDSESSSADILTQNSHGLRKDILKIVPPLSSRLKEGMTFAEFARETTKQYYGGRGTQSKR